MGAKRFSIRDEIKFGWNTMKENLWFLVILLIVAFLIENLPGIIAGRIRSEFPLISTVLLIAGWLLGFVVQMGLIRVSLKFCDGIKGQLDDLLSNFNILVTFIAGTFIYFLIILGGLVLLVVPGIILGVKFSLYAYFIIDKGMGPIEALKASGEATRDAKWDLFLLGLLLGLINIAGALCFIVGLFATIPTSMIAYAHVYRKLTGSGKEPGNYMYVGMGI